MITRKKFEHPDMKLRHQLCRIIPAIWRRLRMNMMRPLFMRYGKDFVFDPDGNYSFHTISVGNHVNLGGRPTINATRSQVIIGNHVLFGPEVVIRGGNHRTDLVGQFIDTVTDKEKRPEDDLGVVIEDDVWVGTRATILHGVTIGRGAVIGAGSVVIRDIPPYAIAVGNPALVKRYRWSVDEIIEHEKQLYSEEQRLSRNDLEMIVNEVSELNENGSKTTSD